MVVDRRYYWETVLADPVLMTFADKSVNPASTHNVPFRVPVAALLSNFIGKACLYYSLYYVFVLRRLNKADATPY